MPPTATQAAKTEDVPARAELAPIAESSWKQVESLPCTVSIEVPVHGFTLKSLLALRPASVVGSRHPTTSNLPLLVNGELVSWCEFEVLGNRLSVRLTDFA